MKLTSKTNEARQMNYKGTLISDVIKSALN